MPSLALLLDLSHSGFAAVLDGEGARILVRSARVPGTRHEDVAEWAEGLLREAGGSFADVAWMAVGVGPGSFTGIRIAMAFAQGLSLPRAFPLHGFTSFEALFLSRNGTSERPVAAVIPANAGRLYVSTGIGDPGALIAAERLADRVPPESILLAPEKSPALDACAAGFAGVWTPGADWDAVAVARHARASGRGAEKPVYLQLSAAEEKARLGSGS